jgi:hypothetical protein
MTKMKKWMVMVMLLFHICILLLLDVSLCQSPAFMNIIIKRWNQLKLHMVSSRVSLPPTKCLMATRRILKTPLSILNPLQRKPWLADERELHQQVCLWPAAAPRRESSLVSVLF